MDLLSKEMSPQEVSLLVRHGAIESIAGCRQVLTETVPEMFRDHGFRELPFDPEFVADLREQDVQIYFELVSSIPPDHTFSEDWEMAYNWIVGDFVEMNREYLRQPKRDSSAGYKIRKWLRDTSVKGTPVAVLLFLGYQALVSQLRYQDARKNLTILRRQLEDADDWLANYDNFVEGLKSVAPRPNWLNALNGTPDPPTPDSYPDQPVAALKYHLGRLCSLKYPKVIESLELIRWELESHNQHYHDDLWGLEKATGAGGQTATQTYMACSLVADHLAVSQGRKRGDLSGARSYMALWGVDVGREAFTKWRKRHASS